MQRRKVSHSTYEKWRRDLDRECKTLSWLDCVTSIENGNKVVEKLKCTVCTRFKDKIMGRRNFSNKWIVGAESVRTSNLRDHARNDQHAHAMMLLNKERCQAQGLNLSSYAPIAKALHKLPDQERGRIRRKFDVAYFVATEKLSFVKYPRICDLEKRHGVDMGTSYINVSAGKNFIHYIAESRRCALTEILSKSKFFSILLDGSTDKGNIDNELLLVIWCDNDGKDEKIHTRIGYFKIMRPQSATAEGLFEVVESGLEQIQVTEMGQCKKLVGIGTDGASANIAAAGLKGLVESKAKWIFWM